MFCLSKSKRTVHDQREDCSRPTGGLFTTNGSNVPSSPRATKRSDISPLSPHYLPIISPLSPHYLPIISPLSPQKLSLRNLDILTFLCNFACPNIRTAYDSSIYHYRPGAGYLPPSGQPLDLRLAHRCLICLQGMRAKGCVQQECSSQEAQGENMLREKIGSSIICVGNLCFQLIGSSHRFHR